MEYFSSDLKLGILGGVQLGKMMLSETRKWDIQTAVLDPSPEAPCNIGSHVFQVGDLMDFDTVYRFGKQVDVLTIEIENVNVQALKALEKEGVTVYPSGQTLEIIQSKAQQKLFYVDNALPTAEFSRFGYKAELKAAMTNSIIKYPFVWKSAKFGYDGRGVKIVRNEADFNDLPNVECIVEELVDFKNELAL